MMSSKNQMQFWCHIILWHFNSKNLVTLQTLKAHPHSVEDLESLNHFWLGVALQYATVPSAWFTMASWIVNFG